MIRKPSLGGLLAASAAAALAVPTPYARAEDTKTLDDIQIEGEVRLPRVLFITSRETARPLDFLDLCFPPVEGQEFPTGPVPVVDTSTDAAPEAAALRASDSESIDSENSDPSREESR